MFRRVGALLVSVAVLAFALWWGFGRMTTTVTIGSGPIVLVQNGAMQTNYGTPVGGGPVGVTLPLASQAGTALVAIVSNASLATGATVTSFPAGWVKLASAVETTNSDIEVWVYLNNPGGINAVTFQTVLSASWQTHLSEWSNVVSASATETSGTANAVGGTTLTPTTTGSVISAGDLALSAWIQKIASGTCSFTSPIGWIGLSDNGSVSGLNHMDVEYRIGPPVGILSPLLTSSATTNPTAAGLTLVLKAAPPATDQTAYLRHGSLEIKQNTTDFQLLLGGRYLLESSTADGYLLEDGSGVLLLDTVVPSLGDPVTITGPTWSGRVVSRNRRDIVDKLTNYNEVSVAAINSTVAIGGYYQLEDGSGNLQLEDGTGNYLLESAAAAPFNLSSTPTQGNLLTLNQGSFETDTTGWTAGANTTIARNITFALDGLDSCRFSSGAAGDTSAFTLAGTAGFPVTAKVTYSARAGFFADVAPSRSCNLKITWYDYSGASLGSVTGANITDTTPTWTIATVSGEAPAGALYAQLTATVVANAGAAERHYIDAIALRPGTDTSFVAGGTAPLKGYRHLQVRDSQNQDGTTTIYGSLEMFEVGFAAGQTFTLTSANLGYVAQGFTVTNVSESFLGAAVTGQPTPVFMVEFGDPYQTMQTAGGGVLTKQGSAAVIVAGVAMPGGTLGSAQVTANQTGISTATDLTGLATTVTVISGRRITIESYIRVLQNTSTGTVSLTVQEGTTILTTAVATLTATSQATLNPKVALTPTAGVHIYKLTLATSAGTVDLNAAGAYPALIIVKDIGT